ncbi:MAG: acetylxylan esterase, partial [Armatimonadetes bacterium]|nr:acetylxylan esterase [Armatimonadota bacterium]
IRSGAWPYTEMSRYLDERPETRQQLERTLTYFDAANFAPDIKGPVLLSVGLLDSVALPAAVYGLANVIPAPNEVQVFPQAGHEGGGQDLWEYKLEWLEKVLATEPTE